MAWEYLEEDKFTERYRKASNFLGVLNGEGIADFNSGNSLFKNYLQGKFDYYSNDIRDQRARYLLSDEDFLDHLYENKVPIDIVCCFGMGGFEFSNHPLESSTITDTLIASLDYLRPQYVILECITKYDSLITTIYNTCSNFYDKACDVTIDLNEDGQQSPYYMRHLVILKLR